jgi:Na+/H+ antiporter NhaD/arsenite permease-like protein
MTVAQLNSKAAEIPLWLVGPFALLLILIAVMPVAPARLKHLWERMYPLVACGLGALVVAYYLVRVTDGAHTVVGTGHEYFSFIVLIGSLFVAAGGIHIKVTGEATPIVNIAFLAVAAVAANFIGTTGASMVLIRPWIRMNKIRISAYHVVFFIFIVSNIGGALTPIGDPPLFLGYLRGVPFFWLVEHVVVAWLVTLALILGVFYLYDRRSFRHMPRPLQRAVATDPESWHLDGSANILFLLVIVGAVFLPERWLLREVVMLGAAAASYFTTRPAIHEQNAFTFGPIKEVAFLFLGIFATMMPALDFLTAHGPALGVERPLQYYFASGGLSSVLDNAPTYLNFLQLAQATAAADNPAAFAHISGDKVAAVRALLAVRPEFVIAVSLGAVFFGAMTYIGNGPNFMVRSIAHQAGVHCPSFFGYVARYSLPILLPILAAVGWIFL